MEHIIFPYRVGALGFAVGVWLVMGALFAPIGKVYSQNQIFPAFFILGDSLVDAGNNNYITTVAKANNLPFGIDFPGGPTGRFSNGKIVTDVLCEILSLPFPPPYLAPTTRGAAILQGVNYASAAAGIVRRTGYDFVSIKKKIPSKLTIYSMLYFVRTARRIHQKGIKIWADLWMVDTGNWITDDQLIIMFKLRPWELQLVRARINSFPVNDYWQLSLTLPPSPLLFCWKGGFKITNPPSLIKEPIPPIHVTLNTRWNVLLDRQQWQFKFSSIWNHAIHPKKSILLWLILHKALWTGEKSRAAGQSDGKCPRCQANVEDIYHLFLVCPFNIPILNPLGRILGFAPTWKQLMLGDSVKILSVYWAAARAEMLWIIWKQRNGYIFGGAYQTVSLKNLFADCHFQVTTLQMEQARLYRLRTSILKDTAEYYVRHYKECYTKLHEDDTAEILSSWTAEIREQFFDLSTKIAEGKEFLIKLQEEIDALP